MNGKRDFCELQKSLLCDMGSAASVKRLIL